MVLYVGLGVIITQKSTLPIPMLPEPEIVGINTHLDVQVAQKLIVTSRTAFNDSVETYCKLSGTMTQLYVGTSPI